MKLYIILNYNIYTRFFDSRTEDKNIKVIFTKNASKKKKFTSK